MSKVAIVTDSTACFPKEIIQGYPMFVAPLQVIWGDQSYQDGVDIQPSEFYTRLSNSKTMPTTSQTTPGYFAELYTRLLDQGYDILSVHISSRLSGTLDSAIQARKMVMNGKGRISLVDTYGAGMAMGFPALIAARAAKQGATLEECRILTENAVKNSGVFVVVPTLDYLYRGGRIGGAAAFVGSVLNLKPIIKLIDGRLDAVDKVRTFSKAVNQMTELFLKDVNGRLPVRIAVHHANCPDAARMLLDRVCARFSASDVAEAFIADVSPVIGAHIGPGALGIAFLAGM
ncbi:EDD domain protein, DegV family [Longilinea arvoryzae]|uniref:EDD domain protein, DegV family n=1 Tax=Longilinea arvoryzae TaxID=360412 RepID=A0A0S7BA16_9CHLR|nr:DegV family protein [Longilinea arvoryzae]GAP14396.1 EDD domain protein, DegV family [Longilinea arvoryzae]